MHRTASISPSPLEFSVLLHTFVVKQGASSRSTSSTTTATLSSTRQRRSGASRPQQRTKASSRQQILEVESKSAISTTELQSQVQFVPTFQRSNVPTFQRRKTEVQKQRKRQTNERTNGKRTANERRANGELSGRYFSTFDFSALSVIHLTLHFMGITVFSRTLFFLKSKSRTKIVRSSAVKERAAWIGDPIL